MDQRATRDSQKRLMGTRSYVVGEYCTVRTVRHLHGGVQEPGTDG